MQYQKNLDLNTLEWKKIEKDLIKGIPWSTNNSSLPSINLQKTAYCNGELCIKANYLQKFTYASYIFTIIITILVFSYIIQWVSIGFDTANQSFWTIIGSIYSIISWSIFVWMFIVYLLLIPSLTFSKEERKIIIENKFKVKHIYLFDDIYAIQLIEDEKRNKRWRYTVYELNFILNNTKKVEIYYHTDGKSILEQGKIISQYIEKPFLIKNKTWIISL